MGMDAVFILDGDKLSESHRGVVPVKLIRQQLKEKFGAHVSSVRAISNIEVICDGTHVLAPVQISLTCRYYGSFYQRGPRQTIIDIGEFLSTFGPLFYGNDHKGYDGFSSWQVAKTISLK